MPEYRRGIVIENPNSSYARHPHRKRRIYSQFARSGLGLIYIPADNRDEVEGRLYDLNLGDGDIVFGVGGDGTAQHFANLALSDTGDEIGLSKVPFVPIKGGNACDIAHMLNGNASPREIITHGKEIDVHAIELRINDEFFVHAIGYAGLNADAHATEVLDALKPTFRPWERRSGVQLVTETMATLDAMANVGPIEVSRGDEWEEVTQITFLNGDRIAKLGRSHSSLDRPEFEELVLAAHTRAAVLGRMLQMGAGKLYGRMTDNTDLTVRKKPTDDKPTGMIAMQVDGEVSHIPAGESGVRVQARTAERTFRSISTRLPK